MDDLIEKWSLYDPEGTGFLSPEDFVFLLYDMTPPLGMKEENVSTIQL